MDDPELAETTDIAVTWDLESEHSGDLLRLGRLLQGRSSFTLVVLQYSDSVYRGRVNRYLAHLWREAPTVDAREVDGEFSALEDRLADAAEQHGAVQLVGLEDWPHGPEKLWKAFNYHRELIAERCPVPLLVWVLQGRVREMALEAPDFWSWRSGVFDFGNRPKPLDVGPWNHFFDFSNAPGPERRARLEEIDAYLAKREGSIHPADLRLLVERGQLLVGLGDVSGALESLEAAVEGYSKGDDRRGEAFAWKALAHTHSVTGDRDRALEILEEEALPTITRLGDLQAKAWFEASRAALLTEGGLLDKARDILYTDILPVAQRFGDVALEAEAWESLGSIFESEGNFEEALSIFREKALPLAEQSGSSFRKAFVISRVAGSLRSLGDLEEASRLFRDEVLPPLEYLGLDLVKPIVKVQLGAISIHREQWEEARGYLESALEGLESLNHVLANQVRGLLEMLEVSSAEVSNEELE